MKNLSEIKLVCESRLAKQVLFVIENTHYAKRTRDMMGRSELVVDSYSNGYTPDFIRTANDGEIVEFDWNAVPWDIDYSFPKALDDLLTAAQRKGDGFHYLLLTKDEYDGVSLERHADYSKEYDVFSHIWLALDTGDVLQYDDRKEEMVVC